jgi:heat-inducible transcriptional repressor
VFFSGKNNILKQPEYNNIDEVKRIVNKFEDESLVRKIEETGDGINVYIGDESQFDPNVTVIKTKYNLNGEEGTIAIVGPKRMEYDRVIGLLEYLSNELNEK